MFRHLLWKRNGIDLSKRLISFFWTPSVLPMYSPEIATDAMIIPRLVPGIHPPPDGLLTGSEVVTSATFNVSAFFDPPLDEGEFLKKVEVWANLAGSYVFYSESTDVTFRTIFAPRKNYYLVAYYQNSYAHIETKTSPIYSIPESGVLVGAFDSFSDASILPKTDGFAQIIDTFYFYTGILNASYESEFTSGASVLKIQSSDIIFASEFSFFAAVTNSDSWGEILVSIFSDSSVLPVANSQLTTIPSYPFSTSGVLLS